MTVEMVYMTDPDVQVNTRTILKEEVEEVGQVSFDKFAIGFALVDTSNPDWQ